MFQQKSSKMGNHGTVLREQLFKLTMQYTTPEDALELFSYPCFDPDKYKRLDIATATIFFCYIKFIIQRINYACIEGIWEKLLKKTIIYSQNISKADIIFFNGSFSNNLSSNPVKITEPEIIIWLNGILCSPYMKCPNPYIRLELFRLMRIFVRDGEDRLMDWTPICKTFIHTVSEIQPHCLYHRGDKNDPMFGVTDMELIFQMLSIHKGFPEAILEDISSDYFNNSNQVLIDSKESIFISHCIQAIGVYAVMADCNNDSDKQVTDILDCFRILKNVVQLGGKVRPVEQLPGRWLVTFPPYQQYVIESLQHLSAAIMNIHITDSELPLAYLRDIFVRNLDVSTKTSILPKLLLSRQAGFTSIQPRLLLLKNMDRHANERFKREFNFDSDMHWMETFIEEYINEHVTISYSDSDNRTNSSPNSEVDSNYWEDSSSSDDFSDESTDYGQNSSDFNTSMSCDSSEDTDSSTSDASSEDIDD